MSSIKVKQETSGDDFRTMTRQWGYALEPAPAQRPKRKVRQPIELPEAVKELLNVFFTVSGAVTTSIAFAWLAGWIKFQG